METTGVGGSNNSGMVCPTDNPRQAGQGQVPWKMAPAEREGKPPNGETPKRRKQGEWRPCLARCRPAQDLQRGDGDQRGPRQPGVCAAPALGPTPMKRGRVARCMQPAMRRSIPAVCPYGIDPDSHGGTRTHDLPRVSSTPHQISHPGQTRLGITAEALPSTSPPPLPPGVGGQANPPGAENFFPTIDSPKGGFSELLLPKGAKLVQQVEVPTIMFVDFDRSLV